MTTQVPERKKTLKLNDEVHYPLNDRTLHLLSNGIIDWNSIDKHKDSDAEIVDMLGVTTEIALTTPTSERTRPSGSFFK